MIFYIRGASTGMDNQWTEWLHQEWKKDYFLKLSDFLKNAYETKEIYPPKQQVFSAFHHCDYKDIKVVILGQDPYHGDNQAHGLSFSVQKGIALPPSLLNIYKELESAGTWFVFLS